MVANNTDPNNLNLLVVDGNYGRLTEACVKDFQHWQNLPVDGQAGDATTAAIDSEIALVK
jgi:peptidoglycan hydrolase-like protein with peptidoglycan-binding domain